MSRRWVVEADSLREALEVTKDREAGEVEVRVSAVTMSACSVLDLASSSDGVDVFVVDRGEPEHVEAITKTGARICLAEGTPWPCVQERRRCARLLGLDLAGDDQEG